MAVQCIYVWNDEGEDGDRREWRLPGLLYADDLVLCESEEDPRVMDRVPNEWIRELCGMRKVLGERILMKASYGGLAM